MFHYGDLQVDFMSYQVIIHHMPCFFSATAGESHQSSCASVSPPFASSMGRCDLKKPAPMDPQKNTTNLVKKSWDPRNHKSYGCFQK